MKYKGSSFPFKSSPAKNWQRTGNPKEDAEHNKHMQKKGTSTESKPKQKTLLYSPSGREGMIYS